MKAPRRSLLRIAVRYLKSNSMDSFTSYIFTYLRQSLVI